MAPLSLVTGATGFIGQALVQHLLTQGERVIAVARHPGPPRPNLTWHAQDLARHAELPLALLRGVDRIFLVAALAHRPAPRDTAGQALLHRLNVEHPPAVARQAAAAGVTRLGFLSSIGAQGNSGVMTPDGPCRPATAYGRSKLAAEAGLHDVATATGLAVTILRPPLVVGPDAPGNLRAIIAHARAGRPLPRATLGNRRSLVGLTGLVEALDLATRHPDGAGATLLVAESPPLSTGALFRALVAAAGRPARFVPLPAFAVDPLLRLAGRGAQADALFGDLIIEDARLHTMGWRPTSTLAQEITRAVLAPKVDDH